MLNALTNVGFWGQSGHGAGFSVCPLMTHSGLQPQTGKRLLILHHPSVDQLKRLGRHSDLTSKRVVQQGDQIDNRAGEELGFMVSAATP
jgi:hypothetical protein